VRWLRTNKKTAQVSGIAQTGPTALSGLVAGGDEILAIDGKSLSEWAGDGVKLQELTAGEEVYIFWTCSWCAVIMSVCMFVEAARDYCE